MTTTILVATTTHTSDDGDTKPREDDNSLRDADNTGDNDDGDVRPRDADTTIDGGDT